MSLNINKIYKDLCNIRERDPYKVQDEVERLLDKLKVPYDRIYDINPLIAAIKGHPRQSLVNVLKINFKEHSKLVLVGKGITYDTGGLNLKTHGMEDMVFDKTGAMLAVAVSIVTKVPALVAFSDNCITNQYYYAGQIIKTRSGVRVFNKNTDAEGRILLAGLLEELEQEVTAITLATLTGAAHSFMGDRGGALVHSEHPELLQALIKPFMKGKSRLFPAPVLESNKEIIKSKIKGADIENLGHGGGRGSQAGYEFLRYFHPKLVHVDLAAMMHDANHNALGWGIDDIKQLIKLVRKYEI